MMKTVHVLISGKVQGVWFRANTKKQAEKQDVCGWVKNTADGKVEAVFQGSTDVVDDLVQWCHQGSSLSNVINIDVKIIQTDETFKGFNITY